MKNTITTIATLALLKMLSGQPAYADPYEGYRLPPSKNAQVEQRITTDTRTGESTYQIIPKYFGPANKEGQSVWAFAKYTPQTNTVDYAGAGYIFSLGKLHGTLDLESTFGNTPQIYPSAYYTIDCGKGMVDGANWYNPSDGTNSGFIDYMQNLGKGWCIGPKLNYNPQGTDIGIVVGQYNPTGFWSVNAGKSGTMLRVGVNF